MTHDVSVFFNEDDFCIILFFCCFLHDDCFNCLYNCYISETLLMLQETIYQRTTCVTFSDVTRQPDTSPTHYATSVRRSWWKERYSRRRWVACHARMIFPTWSPQPRRWRVKRSPLKVCTQVSTGPCKQHILSKFRDIWCAVFEYKWIDPLKFVNFISWIHWVYIKNYELQILSALTSSCNIW